MRSLMLVKDDHRSLLRILRIMQIPVMPGIPGHDAFCAAERTLVRLSADTLRYERTITNCLTCDGARIV